MQFKPNATVAAIVRCADEFLYVEELDNNNYVLNQPAGHIEANESIIDAMKRELYEETGLKLEPEYLVGIYYFYSELNEKHYLRFCFYFQVENKPKCSPKDSDIIGTQWLTKAQLLDKKRYWRSSIVGQCLDDYFTGEKIPLSAIKTNL